MFLDVHQQKTDFWRCLTIVD